MSSVSAGHGTKITHKWGLPEIGVYGTINLPSSIFEVTHCTKYSGDFSEIDTM